jgi:hypothetical protein
MWLNLNNPRRNRGFGHPSGTKALKGLNILAFYDYFLYLVLVSLYY